MADPTHLICPAAAVQFAGEVGEQAGEQGHLDSARHPSREGRPLVGQKQGPRPCEFIGFGDLHGPKPYEFIGFGDLHGPKPYAFIGLHKATYLHHMLDPQRLFLLGCCRPAAGYNGDLSFSRSPHL